MVIMYRTISFFLEIIGMILPEISLIKHFKEQDLTYRWKTITVWKKFKECLSFFLSLLQRF